MSKKNNYKVYVHINKINGKKYFGITKQKVEKRWQNGYGYKRNKHFWDSICKYGWNEGFEHIVIAKGLTEEEAKWLEIELIREWNTTNREYGYNITKGGDSSPMDNEKTRKKVIEAKKGYKHTKETRKKISEGNKGKTHTEETRKKMSESHKGKNNHKATKVYCVELEQYFNTVIEASEYVGCDRSNVSMVLTGKTKTAGGYHWVYAEDVNEENINKVMSLKIGKGIPTKVYCVELDIYFNSITEAGEYVGCSRSNISQVLGKNKTAKGYHWIYAEDVDIENSKVS